MLVCVCACMCVHVCACVCVCVCVCVCLCTRRGISRATPPLQQHTHPPDRPWYALRRQTRSWLPVARRAIIMAMSLASLAEGGRAGQGGAGWVGQDGAGGAGNSGRAVGRSQPAGGRVGARGGVRTHRAAHVAGQGAQPCARPAGRLHSAPPPPALSSSCCSCCCCCCCCWRPAPPCPPAAVDKVGDLEVARHAVSELLAILRHLVVQVDGGGVLRGRSKGEGGRAREAGR